MILAGYILDVVVNNQISIAFALPTVIMEVKPWMEVTL